jgi:hypothetical protein
MIVTVTLGRPELDAEAKNARFIRARELLEGAGWLFDEYASDLNGELLNAAGYGREGEREDIFREIQIVVGLKDHLLQIIKTHQAELKLNERKHRNDKPADHD